jgi:hypothetical protein
MTLRYMKQAPEGYAPEDAAGVARSLKHRNREAQARRH